jgi:hypothetical protein
VVRLLALVFVGIVVAGCGETKGRYATFDDLTERQWEVWRDASGTQTYLRSPLSASNGHTYSCADDQARPAFRIAGPTLQSSMGSSGLAEIPPPTMHYRSGAALWRAFERSVFFTRQDVETAVRHGSARGKPRWVRDFEKNCPNS